jgi:hypothetical protein
MAFFGSTWNDDIDDDDIGPLSHWNDDLDDLDDVDLIKWSE